MTRKGIETADVLAAVGPALTDSDEVVVVQDEFTDELDVIEGSEIVEVTLGMLSVDTRVQRAVLNEKRAEKIANEFRPASFGLPAISIRADGTHVELDGMHRIHALRLVLIRNGQDADSFKIRCEAWRGLDLEAEAKIFLLRNNTAQVSKIDTYLVSLTANDPTALAIETFVRRLGWKISNAKTDGTISAIVTLLAAYNRDPWATEQALEVATAAWGHDSDAADGRVLGGLALFIHHYGNKIEFSDLVEKLKKDMPPATLIGKATGYKAMVTATFHRAVLEQVLRMYNANRRTTKLDPYAG